MPLRHPLGKIFAGLLLLAFGLGMAPQAGLAALDLRVCAIQGYSFTSPYVGREVRTQGVVFADLDVTSRRGFFIQHPNCDDKATTSDGIFVYLGERVDLVSQGDWVQVKGVVEEYYGRTEVVAAPSQVQVIRRGDPLPTPVELSPPFNNNQARYYFETLEGMHVHLGAGRVVGPTDGDQRTWLVRSDLGLERVFAEDPAGTGEVICVDDNGLAKIVPQAYVGDEVRSLRGYIDYRVGIYCMELLEAPALIAAPRPPWPPSPSAGGITVATFNLANLFDDTDDPQTDDQVLSATEYQRRLYKRALAIHHALGEPTLIGVQEAENSAVLRALIEDPDVIHADYGILLQDGPDRRGLDVGLLYRTDQVLVLDYQARQGCTTLVDGLGPDGNGDPANPQNARTCDTNGDGIADGNRLFARPPLVAHLRVDLPNTGNPGAPPTVELWVIVNHWKSKVEDTYFNAYTLPRRTAEAQFVASLVAEIRSLYPRPNLLVLGDLNDTPASPPIATLLGQGLVDLTARLPPSQRYSYIYNGLSQMVDYILWSPNLGLMVGEVKAMPINADYPYSLMGHMDSLHRSSDHDLFWVRLDWVSLQPLYLPLMLR